MSGITIPIPEIMETIEQFYDNWHELRINCHDNCFIEDSAGELVKEFKTLDDLYRWVVDRQMELDEQRKEAIKQQGYIED